MKVRPIMTDVLVIGLVALAAFDIGLHDASVAEPPAHSNLILGSPSIVTCPTSNCPSPPADPVLSTQFVHGITSKGAKQAEWLSNIGLFVKTGAPDGQKVAQYIGVMQSKGAGTAWALNTDLVRNAGLGSQNSFGGFEGSGQPGKPGDIGNRNGSIGYELDFTNWDADASPGKGPFTVGEYIHAQGSFTSLSALYFDALMGDAPPRKGWDNGIIFNGERVVESNTFLDATASHSSLTIVGHHDYGVNATGANKDMHALIMRSGQTVCFDGLGDCLVWSAGALSFLNKKGNAVLKIDENGNADFAGHVTSK